MEMIYQSLYGFFSKMQQGIARFFVSGGDQKNKFLNKLSYLLTIASIVAGTATYIVLSKTESFEDTLDTLYFLLNIDVILLLALAALVARRVVVLWLDRRKQQAGSSLHVKLVLIFSLLAALPAILMTVFSIFFFEMGVQTWFGDRISTAITESKEVAQAYLKEHQQTIRADALAMANDMDRSYVQLVSKPFRLEEFVETQSRLRNLTEAYIIDSTGRVLATGGLGLSFSLPKTLTDDDFANAQTNSVLLLVGEQEDKVYALAKLNSFIDRYLFVGRLIEDGVLNHIELTEKAVQSYLALEGRQSGLKITVTLIYALVAMLLLISSVWIGLIIAEHLIKPIQDLIQAAERVRSGDLNARVSHENREDETGILARAFNRMTDQLSRQRQDLIQANKKLDERRRFTEAVLSGVSTGVMGLGHAGDVIICNEPGLALLGFDSEDKIRGKKMADINSEIEKIRRALRRNPNKSIETEITVMDEKKGSERLTWVVRMSAQLRDDDIEGYIVTFDDITPMVKAQKQSAWADVARRIAHEIKNPLTPIQLSAERLNKKSQALDEKDQESFKSYTDTIIRHVENIGRMVDEFSSFARLPAPQKKSSDIVIICREVIFIYDQSHPKIDYILHPEEKTMKLFFDTKQMSQAITNLVKNATESVEKAIADGDIDHGQIEISIQSTEDGESIDIVITDNGKGLPEDIPLQQLIDPYVTTRDNGTGLGLAIVSKIIEDHNGQLILGNQENQPGAKIHIKLPKNLKEK